MLRVPYETLMAEFVRILEKYGIHGDDARLAAKLWADASADGVATHGLNRVERFVKYVKNGTVKVDKRAVKVASFGALERWDGQGGPGALNAWICTERAIELAKQHLVGVVALKNNNHWMRAGNYGIEMTKHGCIGILWTNTVPNMPAWGGKEAKLGNDPIVFAVPYKQAPVVVDVAMSMFSYGKLSLYKDQGVMCPVDGGLDENGNITRDPAQILKTRQPLPMGYWKGSSLSLALDLIAAALSGGDTSLEIGKKPFETDVSQVFIAINLEALPDKDDIERRIGLSLEDLKASTPVKEGGRPVHYPGEGMLQKREDSMKNGVPVDENIWRKVQEL